MVTELCRAAGGAFATQNPAAAPCRRIVFASLSVLPPLRAVAPTRLCPAPTVPTHQVEVPRPSPRLSADALQRHIEKFLAGQPHVQGGH